jgi:hypothetical protein
MPEDAKKDEKLCPKCKKNPRQEPHSCPYRVEIDDDNDPEYCMCCKECEGECLDDI